MIDTIIFYPLSLPFAALSLCFWLSSRDKHTLASALFYLCLEWFNFVRKYNFDVLEKNAADRPDGVPLVTVCNHSSCLDDPCLWGKTCFSLIICQGNVFAGNYCQSLCTLIFFWRISYMEKVFELFPTFQNRRDFWWCEYFELETLFSPLPQKLEKAIEILVF